MTFLRLGPLADEVDRLSSFTRAGPSMACLSAVATKGTVFKSDLLHSWMDVPAVVPEWCRLRLQPTISLILPASPGMMTMDSIWGRVKTCGSNKKRTSSVKQSGSNIKCQRAWQREPWHSHASNLKILTSCPSVQRPSRHRSGLTRWVDLEGRSAIPLVS